MTKTITSLTDHQTSMFDYYIQKWTRIGLSTNNPNNIRELVDAVYITAGLTPPKKIIVEDSPVSSFVSSFDVWDSVWASVGASVGDSVWDSVGDFQYGCHSAHEFAIYDYFRNECGLVEQTNPIIPIMELSKLIGGWAPMRNMCIVSQQPEFYKFDDNGQLHCADGKAIRYRDGFGCYNWHGTRIPQEYAWIIENKQYSIIDIDNISNQEMKRVAIEKYGPGRYVLESSYVEVDQSKYGRLLRKDMLDDENIMVVEVVNATPEPDGSFKTYFLRVPPTMTTAHEAVAWTCGQSAKDYNPIAES